MDERECKKEEIIGDEELSNVFRSSSPSPVKDEPVDEYNQDGVGQILAPLDGQSGRNNDSSAPKLEKIDDYTDSAIEEPRIEISAVKGNPDDSDKPAKSSVLSENDKNDSTAHEVSQSESERQKSSENAEEGNLHCTKCDYSSNSVPAWYQHYRHKHSMTTAQAGVALRCECGYESFSLYGHNCEIAKYSVIAKEARPQKRNDTELECPECDYRSNSALAWTIHLRVKHSTTTALAGLALLCKCGRECLSSSHATTCDEGTFTVIRKREGPILRLEDQRAAAELALKEMPQLESEERCHEAFNLPPPPSSVKDEPYDEYIPDLVRLGQVQSRDAQLDQSARCGEIPSIVKLKPEKIEDAIEEPQFVSWAFKDGNLAPPLLTCENNKRKSSFEVAHMESVKKKRRLPDGDDLDCPECDFSTKNANAWINHLRYEHSTTPVQVGLALLCECGVASFSTRHTLTCEISKFSLVQKVFLQDAHRNDTELECPKCDYCSLSVTGWYQHVKKTHSETPKEMGLALRCDCGHEAFSDTHVYDCEIANFCIISKEAPLPKGVNDTELECTECEYRTNSVSAWIQHLKSNHSTSPTLAGLALLCKCGYECVSDSHAYSCEDSSFTVVRKRDGPIITFEEEKVIQELALKVSKWEEEEPYETNSSLQSQKSSTTPKRNYVSKKSERELKCIECEYVTHNVPTWFAHLKAKHSITPANGGFVLLCDCGNESITSSHSFVCDISNFTIIRKKYVPDKQDKKKTPKCLICDMYPKTVLGYVSHLDIYHKLTLKGESIYLKCSCGFEIRSKFDGPHDKKCKGRKYTLHHLEEK